MQSHSFYSCYLTEGPGEHVHHATASDALACCRQRIKVLELETVDRAWDISEAARIDEKKKWEAQVGAANRGLRKVSRQLKLAMAALGNIKANGNRFECDVVEAAMREIGRIDKAAKAQRDKIEALDIPLPLDAK